jgi:short-subunit dehydrogenase
MGKFAEKYGPWAVVTGASAGIGAEYALRIAERGVNVVLVARRRDRLEELASTIEDMYRVEARVAPVDLTSRDLVQALQPAIADLEIGLLVNCAGMGTTGPFLDQDPGMQEAMLNLNCRAPALLTHEIAQGMRERGRGGVIVVSSVSGFCAARGMVSYNATKAYDLIFAEGLASELRRHGVHVQAMCPGGTHSEFQRVAGLEAKNFGPLERLMFTTPTAVVATSLNTLGGRVTVVHGWLNRLLVLSMKLTPRPISTWLFGAFVQRFSAGH